MAQRWSAPLLQRSEFCATAPPAPPPYRGKQGGAAQTDPAKVTGQTGYRDVAAKSREPIAAQTGGLIRGMHAVTSESAEDVLHTRDGSRRSSGAARGRARHTPTVTTQITRTTRVNALATHSRWRVWTRVDAERQYLQAHLQSRANQCPTCSQ